MTMALPLQDDEDPWNIVAQQFRGTLVPAILEEYSCPTILDEYSRPSNSRGVTRANHSGPALDDLADLTQRPTAGIPAVAQKMVLADVPNSLFFVATVVTPVSISEQWWGDKVRLRDRLKNAGGVDAPDSSSGCDPSDARLNGQDEFCGSLSMSPVGTKRHAARQSRNVRC